MLSKSDRNSVPGLSEQLSRPFTMLRLTGRAPPKRPFGVFSFATLLRKIALLAFALALAKAAQKQPERTSGYP